MKVFLLKDVPGTGKAGEAVQVSDGYARNYLFPRKLAREMTAGLTKELDEKKAAEARRKAVNREAAEGISDRMKEMKVVMHAKAGENGKLFGSVSTKEVAEALKAQHGVEVDKKKIELKGKISELGTYELKVRLFEGVSSMLTVEVLAAEEE